MANYCNFISTIVLEDSHFIKDAKTVKVSSMPKGTDNNTRNELVLKATLTKKHGVKYLVQTCMTVLFVQILNNMFGHRNGASLQTICPPWKHPLVNILERGLCDVQQ